MKTFRLKALGYSMEMSAHRLTKDEAKIAKAELENNPDEPALEDILEDYNQYAGNLWQSGCLACVENSRIILTDEDGTPIPLKEGVDPEEGVSVKEIELMAPKVIEEAQSTDGTILVHISENKGEVGTWILKAENPPKLEDLKIEQHRVTAGEDSYDFIGEISHMEENLEQDYEDENSEGKACYFRLV